MVTTHRIIFALIAGLWATTTLAGGDALESGLDSARQGDFTAAARNLEPLARDGSAQAQFNLGLLYHSGLGVGRDEARAVQLYHAAAELGHPLAQEYLAVGYAEGWFGLRKDAVKAQHWSELASKVH